MSIEIITRNGQITIPVDVRNKLGLMTGDKVKFLIEGTSVRILPVIDISSLKGIVAKPEQPVSIGKMKLAVKARGGKI